MPYPWVSCHVPRVLHNPRPLSHGRWCICHIMCIKPATYDQTILLQRFCLWFQNWAWNHTEKVRLLINTHQSAHSERYLMSKFWLDIKHFNTSSSSMIEVRCNTKSWQTMTDKCGRDSSMHLENDAASLSVLKYYLDDTRSSVHFFAFNHTSLLKVQGRSVILDFALFTVTTC